MGTAQVTSWFSRAMAWLLPRENLPATRDVNTDWSARLRTLKERHTGNDALMARYAEANIAAISAAVSGRGPDDGPETSARVSRLGSHMVVNIASAHVAAFCAVRRPGDARPGDARPCDASPYKNTYDLEKYRIGGKLNKGASESRKLVDAALPLPSGKTPRDIYYGAMELNGTGVHFYGDVCLVLSEVDAPTVLLDRNSYDLIRMPLREQIESGPPAGWPKKRSDGALRISGSWGASRDTIAAIKVLGAVGFRARRLTIGQISDAVRDDEDYIELLRIGSFGTNDLSEARLTASDVAQEAAIDSRRRTTPTPTLESLLWRHRRRNAEQELRKSGVPVRIVTTMGRIKG